MLNVSIKEEMAMLSKRLFLVVILLFTAQLFAKNTDVMLQNALNKFQKDIENRNFPISKVAVYHIDSNSPKVDTLSVQDQITNLLLESGKFRVIDRQSLNALLKEQSLSLTGMVDNAAMVKAGKLIGVEGFFFGNINIGTNNVIFTIKLIDVESSALLYSKTIIGEDYSSVELGIAGGYCTGYNHSVTYEYLYNKFDNSGNIISVPFDPPANYPINKSMDFPQFTLIYVQGFKNSKNFKFGLNITYAPETDDLTDLKNDLNYRVDEYNLHFFQTEISTALNYLSFDPDAIIMPNLFGLNTDLFALTLGASLHFYFYNIHSTSSGQASINYDEDFTKITILPTFGAIIKPVKFIHLIVKGLYIPSDIALADNITLSDTYLTNLINKPFLEKGLVFNISLGFTYTF